MSRGVTESVVEDAALAWRAARWERIKSSDGGIGTMDRSVLHVDIAASPIAVGRVIGNRARVQRVRVRRIELRCLEIARGSRQLMLFGPEMFDDRASGGAADSLAEAVNRIRRRRGPLEALYSISRRWLGKPSARNTVQPCIAT